MINVTLKIINNIIYILLYKYHIIIVLQTI